jgi:uncharacterized protein YegP (UPF0339 family)
MANQVKLQLYRDVQAQYRWRLIAGNGEIVAVGEAHTELDSAKRSAQRVTELASQAVIVYHDNLR